MPGIDPQVGGLPESATCRRCGYSLRGLGDRGKCPECGADFDATDPASFRVPRAGWWTKWAKPPNRGMGLLTIIGTVIFLLAASNPGGILGLLFLQELSIVLACCLWYVVPTLVLGDYLVRFVAFVSERVKGDPSPGAFDRRWLAVPVCVLLWLSVFVTAWPIRLRFAGSLAAFDREAKRLLAAASKPAGGMYPEQVGVGRWIGTYHVELARVDVSNNRVEFILDGNAFIWWGFYYDPAGTTGGVEVSRSWTAYVYLK